MRVFPITRTPLGVPTEHHAASSAQDHAATIRLGHLPIGNQGLPEALPRTKQNDAPASAHLTAHTPDNSSIPRKTLNDEDNHQESTG